MNVVLVSGSPRRSLLLATAGFPHEVRRADIDETMVGGEPPAEAVLRLAEAKLATVDGADSEVLLAADTMVVLDGTSLGKPTDVLDAHRMLTALSDRTHSVLTGWVARKDRERRFGISESRVTFKVLTTGEIEQYVAETDPYDKAGAYALQGEGGRLISKVRGSRANVMGLPIREVTEALQELGVVRSTEHALLTGPDR